MSAAGQIGQFDLLLRRERSNHLVVLEAEVLNPG
jgi:hypothetical protein